MENGGLNELSNRLARLERENRRLRRAGLGAIVVFAALILLVLGRPTASVVDAQRFVLRDSRGVVRGMWAVTGPQEAPLFGLYDAQARPRAEIGMEKDAAVGVRLHDPDGRPRLALRVDPAGTPSWHLFDHEERSLAGMDADLTKDVELRLRRDTDGFFVLSANTARFVAVTDLEGTMSGALAVSFGNPPVLKLVNEKGVLVWQTGRQRKTRD